MVKKKKSRINNSTSAGSNTLNYKILLIVGSILLLAAILFFSFRDNTRYNGSKELLGSNLSSFSESCLSHAQNVLRAEFCNYALVEGKIINCRDEEVLVYLGSKGMDVDLPILNCRNVDNYYFRKTACEILAPSNPSIVIADSTCSEYR